MELVIHKCKVCYWNWQYIQDFCLKAFKTSKETNSYNALSQDKNIPGIMEYLNRKSRQTI